MKDVKAIRPYISLLRVNKEDMLKMIKNPIKGTPTCFCYHPETGVVVLWPKPDPAVKDIRVIIDL